MKRNVTLGTVCYLDNGESFLLLHRNKKENDVHHGKWIGVGGKMEDNESPQECAIREIKEETGLVAETLQLKGTILYPNFDGVSDWLVFVFTVPQFSGVLTNGCDEGDLAWVKYEDIANKPTWQGDRLFLEWLLQDKPIFSAKMLYHNEQLEDWSVDFYK